MIDLKNRKVDDYGNVVFEVKDLYPLIRKGFEVTDFLIQDSPEVQQLVSVAKMLDNAEVIPRIYVEPTEPLDAYMSVLRTQWLIPNEFKQLNVVEFLVNKCQREEEINRIVQEMAVFQKYELEDMLRSLIYLVDTFRKNKVVWGVGRGSSVSSYVLYLIGIHRVDSLKYELDFAEFLN